MPTAFSAMVTTPRTYSSGRCRTAATSTESPAMSTDWATKSRSWPRRDAWRSMPNSASKIRTAITFAVPTYAVGAWAGSISHLQGRR